MVHAVALPRIITILRTTIFLVMNLNYSLYSNRSLYQFTAFNYSTYFLIMYCVTGFSAFPVVG